MTHFDDFRRLAAIVSGDCVEWPHGTFTGGYGRVRYRGRSHRVHRLALQLVSSAPDDKPLAIHGDCHNRLCMNALAGHVRWGSAVENMADRRRDGTSTVGTQNGRAKLSEVDVQIIRSLDPVKFRPSDLARQYDVTPQLITQVRNRKVWRHVQ